MRRAGVLQTKEFSTERVFSDLRRPLRDVIKVLTKHSGTVGAEWRRSMQSLSLQKPQMEILASLDIRALCPYLVTGEYDSFRRELERYGRELEKTGVVSEDIHRVLASYVETCLPLVAGSAKTEKGATQAFLRLFSTSQHFIFQGYNQSRMEGSRRIEEQERHKLSRDLHDDIGHSLVVFKLYVEMISKDLKEGNTTLVEQKLEEAKDLIGKAIDSIRRLILDLGPAILDEAGIVPALQLYARQFNVRTGIKVQVQTGDMPEGVPSGHEIALYRVFQGALSNIVKHSHAKHIKVTVGGAGKSAVVMTIEDDGVGFDPSGLKARTGFGLKAMRDRIESLGGHFHVESRPAKFGESRRGTRIEVDLPFSEEER